MIIYADGSGDGKIALTLVYDDAPEANLVSRRHTKTHNESEWEALLWAISVIDTYDLVTILMDSQLVVRQFNGEYRTKSPTMRRYRELAQKKVIQRGLKVTIGWIPREENKAGWLLE